MSIVLRNPILYADYVCSLLIYYNIYIIYNYI